MFPLIFCFGIPFSMASDADNPSMFGWLFYILCFFTVFILFYIWRLGYVEFNNINETVTIKRYYYKFTRAKVVLYHDIKRIDLGKNQQLDDFNTPSTQYLFRLRLKDDSRVVLFNVQSEKLGKKIQIWISEHLKFKTKITRRKVKLREQLFRFGRKE